MRIFAGEPPLTRVVNAALVSILLGLFILPMAFLFVIASAAATGGTLDRALIALVDGGTANPLEISNLVGHAVGRVCVASEYGSVTELAGPAGVSLKQLPNEDIPYEHVALVAVGTTAVTYGTIHTDLFGDHYDGVTSTRPFCQSGDQLAIVFETVSPPHNARVIDLAITDPALFIRSNPP